MEIQVKDDRKMVDIWLTNAEKNDPKIREQLKPLFANYKEKKYLVSVFESGEQDLRTSVLELLRYNKRRSVEREMAREKKQRSAGLEL